MLYKLLKLPTYNTPLSKSNKENKTTNSFYELGDERIEEQMTKVQTPSKIKRIQTSNKEAQRIAQKPRHDSSDENPTICEW